MKREKSCYQQLKNLINTRRTNSFLSYLLKNIVNIIEEIIYQNIVDEDLERFAQQNKLFQIKRAFDIVKNKDKQLIINSSSNNNKQSQCQTRQEYVLINQQTMEEENMIRYFRQFCEHCPSILKPFCTENWHQQAFESILFLMKFSYSYLLERFNTKPSYIFQKLINKEYRLQKDYKNDLKKLRSEVMIQFGCNIKVGDHLVNGVLTHLVYLPK